MQEKAKLCQISGQSNRCNLQFILRLPVSVYIKALQNNGKLYVVFGFPEVQTKGKAKIEMNFLKC